jgi:hypothetical protein
MALGTAPAIFGRQLKMLRHNPAIPRHALFDPPGAIGTGDRRLMRALRRHPSHFCQIRPPPGVADPGLIG